MEAAERPPAERTAGQSSSSGLASSGEQQTSRFGGTSSTPLKQPPSAAGRRRLSVPERIQRNEEVLADTRAWLEQLERNYPSSEDGSNQPQVPRTPISTRESWSQDGQPMSGRMGMSGAQSLSDGVPAAQPDISPTIPMSPPTGAVRQDHGQ